MYAIVKTGGKQYRVEQGQALLVERLPVEDGGEATLQPLLYVDGDNVVDGEGLAKVSIQARVLGHERGPKLRVVKFKPKRGYKRRNGHRQELTRIEVTEIKFSERSPSSRRAPKPGPADEVAASQPEAVAQAPAAEEKPKRPRAKKPAAEVSATEASAVEAEAAVEAEEKPAGEAEAKPGGEAEAKPARPRRKPKSEDNAPAEPEGSDGT